MNKTFPNSLRLCILPLMLLFLNVSFSQDYSRVDNIVETWPRTFTSTDKLAAVINNQFHTDRDKARAIFTWIALNVAYDVPKSKAGARVAFYYSSEKDRQLKKAQYLNGLAQKTIRTGKGICQDYASLLHKLCDQTGLPCIDIPGTAKTSEHQIGKLPLEADHIWNAVKIDGRWSLVDVTWAAGSVDSNTGKYGASFNDGFFCTDPDVFFVNHFPEDSRLTMTGRTQADFANLPLFYGMYANSDMEIVSPTSGILRQKTTLIPFKIADLKDGDVVSYALNDERYAKPAEVRRNGNISEFDINVGAHSRGFVTLYVNNRSLATYKIAR